MLAPREHDGVAARLRFLQFSFDEQIMLDKTVLFGCESKLPTRVVVSVDGLIFELVVGDGWGYGDFSFAIDVHMVRFYLCL
jgi:hypothetical protein